LKNWRRNERQGRLHRGDSDNHRIAFGIYFFLDANYAKCQDVKAIERRLSVLNWLDVLKSQLYVGMKKNVADNFLGAARETVAVAKGYIERK
jgi:hypothetical protein